MEHKLYLKGCKALNPGYPSVEVKCDGEATYSFQIGAIYTEVDFVSTHRDATPPKRIGSSIHGRNDANIPRTGSY